ncbi:hypothetical protein [Methylobacterium sp. WL19]|uniref:hypothetical protein n=1 Tax=Methylobacterium sp. WL19 TaxID=2603896 RepID=UPI00164F4D63|nr:hypothetical protein [Methylobacterium sp. WL19]
MPGKPTFADFGPWAQKNIGFDPTAKSLSSWISTNTRTFLASIEDHIFYSRLQSLVEAHKANATHQQINIVTIKPELNVKSVDSIISKLYRINVVENGNFPNPKGERWVGANDIFKELKDIIRTTIVCRHIDEPAKITALIESICKELELPCHVNAQAKEHGYYAYHVYVVFNFEFTNMAWESFRENVYFEIQITTEMQYMLYALTHVFYEAEREKLDLIQDTWKWDYKSAKFSASYLSHSLHLLEGLLLRLYEDVATNANQPAVLGTEDHALSKSIDNEATDNNAMPEPLGEQ